MPLNLKIKLKKPKKDPKEKAMNDKMKWILKKYRLGELDLLKESHRIPYRIAVSKGLIKEDKNG